MKSRTSYFDRGVFLNILKRTWPLWAAYFLAWFLPFPLVTLVERLQYSARVGAGDFIPAYVGMIFDSSILTGCAISSFVAAPAAAMAVFGFMHTAKNTGLMASLPVKREALFCSAFLAGLLPVVCADILIVLFNLLASVGADLSWSILIKCNLFWLVINLSEFITFYGIAVIISMISANIFAVPALYLIFNFLIPGMETVVNNIVCEFAYGVSSLPNRLTFMSPFIEMLNFKGAIPPANHSEFFAGFHDWGQLTAYLAVGIALSVIALFLYKGHRMESAGDVVAVPKLRPVFKYGVAVCASLCFGVLLYLILSDIIANMDLVVLIVGLIVGAFIGYFVSEMLIKKSLHVFRGHWKGFIVLSVLAVAFSFACAFDLFGVFSRLPDADEISCVYTDAYEVRLSSEDDIAECLRINRAVIDKRSEYLKFVSDAHLSDKDYEIEDNGIRYLGFSYELKNGQTLSRSYQVYDDENFKAYVSLMNDPKAILEKYSPENVEFVPENVCEASLWLSNPLPYEDESGYSERWEIILTPKQAYELYFDAVVPDIMDGNLSMNFYTGEPAEQNRSIGILNIYLEKAEDGYNGAIYSEYLSIDISQSCEHTIAWFKDNMETDLLKQIQ